MIESNVDQKSGNTCILEGPEGIIIHIISSDTIKVQPAYEIIMGAMRPKGEQDGDSDSDDNFSPRVKNTPSVIRNPRPIIHTLDVSIFTINDSKGFTAAPPNNRKPIPFETDVNMLLILIQIFINSFIFVVV